MTACQFDVPVAPGPEPCRKSSAVGLASPVEWTVGDVAQVTSVLLTVAMWRYLFHADWLSQL